MLLGMGTDLVEVARIGRSISTYGAKFVQRVFTDGERTYSESKANSSERFAARFAAKEAAMKALGTGWRDGVSWLQIEVVNESSGKPILTLHGQAGILAARLGVRKTWLSLTHTNQAAAAVVILEG